MALWTCYIIPIKMAFTNKGGTEHFKGFAIQSKENRGYFSHDIYIPQRDLMSKQITSIYWFSDQYASQKSSLEDFCFHIRPFRISFSKDNIVLPDVPFEGKLTISPGWKPMSRHDQNLKFSCFICFSFIKWNKSVRL